MSSLMQLLQYAGPTLMAIYGIVTGLATIFAILAHVPGGFGAFCKKAAAALGVVGVDVQKIINLLKPFFSKAKGPSVPPGATAAFMLLVATLLLVNCTPMVPVVPQTPDNQAQIAACQSLSQAHNAFIVGDFSLGVLDGAGAGIAAGLASSNPTASKDIGIGTSAGAAIVAGGIVLANMYANQYAAERCPDVLGPLPVLPAKKLKAADPPTQVTIVQSSAAAQ